MPEGVVPDPDARTEVAPLAPITASALPTSAEAPLLFAGRYEVLGLLGSGAMGTVYRARDRELDELVALKVLKKELAAASGMLDRFRREVKLARRVTHTNVARTYDIGEDGGERFLTMELIEGEMLGARLARVGRLDAKSAIAIADELCAGLAAAHEAGVLHRDLKPENVIVAKDGRLVITDFGIARAAEEEAKNRTMGGMVGTPAYMAPEQVEGLPDLDARADLYALGVMLYELVTGETPWTGDSIVAIAAARILREPPDPATRAPDLPPAVRALVLRLMARSRDDRFASAADVRAAIAEIRDHQPLTTMVPERPMTARTFRVGARSIAVLPLLNLGAAEDGYLALAMTEDLVDQLSVVPGLRVRPRGETSRFDDRGRDVREIGRALGVDVVIDGSLRRVGDLARIAVRLVTVEDGFQLWARRFDRAPSDIIAVTDEAATSIAHALTAEKAVSPRAAGDPRAQELYLRARYALNRGWWEHGQQNSQMLREAHALAPDDARIAGTLALSLSRGYSNDVSPRETAREARAIASVALALQPEQPEALVALGLLHLAASEGAAAILHLHRALVAAPNNTDALDGMGRMLVEVGRVDDGLGYFRRARAIEPNHGCRYSMARVLSLVGKHEAAEEVLGPMPTSATDMVPHVLGRGRSLLWQKKATEARAMMMSVELEKIDAATRKGLDYLFDVATRIIAPSELGIMDKALPVDDTRTARRACFNAQLRVELFLNSDDTESAVTALRAAEANGLLDLMWLDHCPLLAAIRDRPEFAMIRSTTAVRARRVLDALDGAPR